MKTLSLDIGDRWTGIAISDPSGIIARPYETVESKELAEFLEDVIEREAIGVIVVGYPQTLRGTASEQTLKTKQVFEDLKAEFPTIEWTLFDERFTSKQAAELKRPKTKEEKKASHAIAAAFVLRTYLDFRRFKESM
jgi:putative Holliday junction resolvase